MPAREQQKKQNKIGIMPSRSRDLSKDPTDKAITPDQTYKGNGEGANENNKQQVWETNNLQFLNRASYLIVFEKTNAHPIKNNNINQYLNKITKKKQKSRYNF